MKPNYEQIMKQKDEKIADLQSKIDQAKNEFAELNDQVCKEAYKQKEEKRKMYYRWKWDIFQKSYEYLIKLRNYEHSKADTQLYIDCLYSYRPPNFSDIQEAYKRFDYYRDEFDKSVAELEKNEWRKYCQKQNIPYFTFESIN